MTLDTLALRVSAAAPFRVDVSAKFRRRTPDCRQIVYSPKKKPKFRRIGEGRAVYDFDSDGAKDVLSPTEVSMNKLVRHLQVPRKSQFLISLDPALGYACTGIVSTYDGNNNIADTSWPNGPEPLDLKGTPTSFIVDVNFVFSGAAPLEVVVKSTIVKPDGSTSSKSTPLSGQHGSGISTVTIFIGMKN